MGQRSSPSPHTSLAVLVAKREKLQEELRMVEKQVYDLETSYLHESSHFGNVLKGFEGFLSSSKSSNHLKRSRKFQQEDRLFSLSSVTAPTENDYFAGRADGVSLDALGGQGGRSKGAGLPTVTAIGKQKRGRTAGPREGKRIKQANEQEGDEDELGDMLPRQLI